MSLKDFFVRDKKVEAGAEKAPVSDGKVEVREKEQAENLNLLDAILAGKEIVTTIQTAYGEFQFKYPEGNDHIRIARRRAEYMGGYPDSSFDEYRKMRFEQWSTLDILIVSKPEKFGKLETWANCPDQELVEDLYARGSSFCKDIREEIKQCKPGKPVE